ncbi:neprilysin-11-like isoform X2 [Dinothrombium tinctorium]|uniref:Neprilysin-11-like isoform X2 n=1 Tax=Dinothrombium tinctorium TaxID=1965070 RepID=A0A443QWX4_9ACAR|nr:neprilysin-11-like isoform X2 [Dinothrombium tinctorium]
MKNEIRRLLEAPYNDKIHTTPVLKKPMNLYKGCIDTKMRNSIGVKPLWDMLQRIGGWPMVQRNWTAENYSWHNTYYYLRSRFGSNYILEITIDVNSKDTTSKALHIDSPNFGMGAKELGNPNGDRDTRRLVAAYKTYIRDAANILNFEGISQEEIDKDIDDMFWFESQMAEGTSSNEDRQSQYEEMTIRQLQDQFPGVKWKQLFKKIFKYAKTNIYDSDLVIMQDSKYYRQLPSILRSTPKRVIANYFAWRLVLYYGDFTTDEFADIYFNYQKVSEGLRSQEKVWEFCYETVDDYFDYALGRLYVDNQFNSQAIGDIKRLIRQVKNAVGDDLNQQNWMDLQTKRKAIEKTCNVSCFLPWFMHCFHFLQNKMNKHLVNIDLNSRLSGPAIVNAFNYFDLNYIQFPAGILQPPFYTYKAPASINFGAIANTIGHEVIHAFDDEGKQYDKDGNLKNWWTEETENKYNGKAECFVDQYNRYRDSLTGLNINGINTQGENIADNGGLRVAYKAYKNYINKYGKQRDKLLPGRMSKYTSEQLFFISFASIWCENNRKESMRETIQYGQHCPSRFRVIGTLVNMVEFADAFKCPVDSKMNPRNKCLLW